VHGHGAEQVFFMVESRANV